MSKGPHKYSYTLEGVASEYGYQRFLGRWYCSCGHHGRRVELGIDRFGAERRLRQAHRVHVVKSRTEKSVVA